MVDAVLSGGKPEINDTKTYNNDVKVVPSYPADAGRGRQVELPEAGLVDTGYYKAEQLK